MQTTLKVPKTVKWSEIRALIGDKRTEDIITLKYGPKLLGPPNIKLQKEGLEHMLAHLEGRTIVGMKSTYIHAIPAIFRLYFREAPKAKSRMRLWIKRKLEEIEIEGNGANIGRVQIEAAATEMAAETSKKKRRSKTAERKKVAV